MAAVLADNDLQNNIAPARYYDIRTNEWRPLVDIQELLQNILKAISYIIKDVTEASYTLVTDEDIGTNTIILCKGSTEQTISLVNVTDDFIGKAVVIRKSSEEDTLVNIIPQSGGSIVPSDIGPLRRQGSSVTLVYAGNNTWEAFGELI